MQVARGAVEEIKGTIYGNIAGSVQGMAYDAGSDTVFGTVDDLAGVLTVSIVDALDMDGDGDNAETDGVGFFNDMAKPVRVNFRWNQRLLGATTQMNIDIDTLVAR
jgi:hypothetical protein